MANKTVNLTKRVLTSKGWRYCPVILSANGRVKPDTVLVNSRPEIHKEGAYYLEWYEGGKRRRESVGKNPADAVARQQRQLQILAAETLGLEVTDPEAKDGRIRISDAVEEYLAEVKDSKKPKTHAAYKTALDYFVASCSKTYMDEIERKDLLRYATVLRNDKKLSARTVHNKFASLMSFLKANGIRGLVGKKDWPKYVEPEPRAYEEDELEKFFAVCDEEERAYFRFFLMTGMREQEVIYTFWDNINLRQGVVTVTAKPGHGFSPKDYEEREIPIPDELVTLLAEWKRKHENGSPFVFPTKNGAAKFDFLDICKRVAKRAKLNQDDFWLHKFRATFATMHLRAGVDLRTVQLWLGHRDLESTMRYLKPARGKGVREKVNATFAGAV
jgi:integrase